MTTATKITIARMALIPFILFFYISGTIIWDSFFIQYGKLIALILFIIAAATDWLDGHVARRYNQTSDLGKILDPIADKMLVYLGFVLIATDFGIVGGLVPVWLMVVAVTAALGRDLIVNALRQSAAEKGKNFAADKTGKFKTVLQFVAISLIMFWAFDYDTSQIFEYGTILQVFEFVSIFTLVAATIISVYSGIEYMINYNNMFERGDKKTWEQKIEEKNNDTKEREDDRRQKEST